MSVLPVGGKGSWHLDRLLIHPCADVGEWFCNRKNLLCAEPHCPVVCNGSNDPPSVRSLTEKTQKGVGTDCNHGKNGHSSLASLGLVAPGKQGKEN